VVSTALAKYRIPLRLIVIDNFKEAMKRIKEIVFWPDQVVIKLVSGHPAVRTSVLMLNIRVIGENGRFPYISKELDLTEEYKEDSIDYDEALQAIIIPIPGVKSIIFLDRKNKKIFSKK
jgi:hypothetical protein